MQCNASAVNSKARFFFHAGTIIKLESQQPADDDDDHMSEACSREGHVSQVRERPSVTPTSRTIIHSL